jgi:hypothetical protein
MSSPGHFSSRVLLAAALAAVFLFAASALFAYHRHLDESDIMSAYSLGKSADFNQYAARYVKVFPNTPGVHVTRLGVRTPFYNLVQLRHEQASGPSEMDFRDAYLAHPDTSFVAVISVSTPANPPPGLNSAGSPFWRQFKFEVSQSDVVPPRGISAAPIVFTAYNDPGQGTYDMVTGAEMYLYYEVEDIDSGTLHLTVKNPDGTTASVDFDLDKLR